MVKTVKKRRRWKPSSAWCTTTKDVRSSHTTSSYLNGMWSNRLSPSTLFSVWIFQWILLNHHPPYKVWPNPEVAKKRFSFKSSIHWPYRTNRYRRYFQSLFLHSTTATTTILILCVHFRGWEQMEVTCNPSKWDGKNRWTIERVIDDRCKLAERMLILLNILTLSYYWFYVVSIFAKR